MAKLMSLIMIALSSVISLAAQNSPVEIIQRSLDSVGPKSERERVKSIHAIADCSGQTANTSPRSTPRAVRGSFSGRPERMALPTSGFKTALHIGRAE
ncbi:MAG: hypothetical protein IPJ30_23455 [Acidobacteria bacterium]|nr:hypothetical protein [Acidobacteriota bacterium]